MNNIGSNISAGAVVTLGIFTLDDNQFKPLTFIFYLIGIAIVAFIVSFLWEWLQDKAWKWMQNRASSKEKKHGMGLGNRYF